jgi:hypothetical protein
MGKIPCTLQESNTEPSVVKHRIAVMEYAQKIFVFWEVIWTHETSSLAPKLPQFVAEYSR